MNIVDSYNLIILSSKNDVQYQIMNNQNPYPQPQNGQDYNPMDGINSFHNMYEQAGNQLQPMDAGRSSHNNNELTNNGICKRFIHGKCKNSDCPNPHDKTKIKTCDKYELNGHCPYGERCNFSHQVKACSDFSRNSCTRQICPYRHVFKACPNFDMGFCALGDICKLKHIIRKLCWDYMYGYCEKGNKCVDHHPKVYVQEDFTHTKVLYEKLSKGTLEIIVCKSCKVIGHKVNKCPKKHEIDPKQVFKCGLCGLTHFYIDDCNYLK